MNVFLVFCPIYQLIEKIIYRLTDYKIIVSSSPSLRRVEQDPTIVLDHKLIIKCSHQFTMNQILQVTVTQNSPSVKSQTQSIESHQQNKKAT